MKPKLFAEIYCKITSRSSKVQSIERDWELHVIHKYVQQFDAINEMEEKNSFGTKEVIVSIHF